MRAKQRVARQMEIATSKLVPRRSGLNEKSGLAENRFARGASSTGTADARQNEAVMTMEYKHIL